MHVYIDPMHSKEDCLSGQKDEPELMKAEKLHLLGFGIRMSP